MTNLFIETKYLNMLIEIFKEYCPSCEVYAYGSRINNTAHEGSDLDLTIKKFPKDKYLFELKEKISNSNIPFLIDLNLFDRIYIIIKLWWNKWVQKRIKKKIFL